MKTIYVFLTIITTLSLSIDSSAQAPNTWIQKANFGGTGRIYAVGFSIGAKGYIGTGNNDPGYDNDFWEYDTTTNAWTQKANFGGTGRDYAVGFSIGAKGYIGTGMVYNYVLTYYNDFWEYDTTTNAWSQKANFGGTGRALAVGFSIGSKGYIGTGEDSSGYRKDFWEYDPSTNNWAQKANFGGTGRYYAVGFGIGAKGYLGMGQDSSYYQTDFWEYDPAINNWTKKNNFGGTGRISTVGFSIGANGYIGTGIGAGPVFYNDFWEYDTTTNVWSQVTNFGGTARIGAIGFSIGNKGFIGTGDDYNNVIENDFWEYTPSNPCPLPPPPTNTTPSSDQTICSGHSTTLSASGSGNLSWYSAAVSGTWLGSGPSFTTPLLTSDTVFYVQDSTCAASASRTSISVSVLKEGWSQKANFSGVGRSFAVGFSIGSKGYIGTGANYIFYNDFWEYDPLSNIWSQKANFAGTPRYCAVGFSIGAKGYIGTGADSSGYRNDFWEYDPSTNTWTRKADYGGGARFAAVGFSIGSKGYLGTGADSIGNDAPFWEYDPFFNTWTPKADFSGGRPRTIAVGFSIGTKGYIGTGAGPASFENDFWEYDPSTNIWTQKANFGGTPRVEAAGFSIGNKGYIGTGTDNLLKTDFWEYDPLLNTWSQKANFIGTPRENAMGFSIGNHGYIGTGEGLIVDPNDFWEYTPSCSCTPPNISFISCYDTITTINARPIKLKGGIPLGGYYSGPGVDSLTGSFTPSIAGAGIKTVSYTYTNVDSCSGRKNIHILVQPSPIFTCGNNLTDIRDNKVYPTILIGSQCWLSSNLNFGTSIPSSQVQRDNCIAEKYCFNDNPINCTNQGGLYQWDELMQYDNTPGNQGFCPPGWHIPTESDWLQLFSNFPDSAHAAIYLKSSGTSGFNALLTGSLYFNESWDYHGFASFFWSSTANGPIKAWAHGMNDPDPSVSLYSAMRSDAFSVRCIMN